MSKLLFFAVVVITILVFHDCAPPAGAMTPNARENRAADAVIDRETEFSYDLAYVWLDTRGDALIGNCRSARKRTSCPYRITLFDPLDRPVLFERGRVTVSHRGEASFRLRPYALKRR